MDTFKPVFIRYNEDVDGYLAGATFEIPTPEQAWAQHPNAQIIRYADGDRYVHGQAKKAVRERDADEVEGTDEAPVKRGKGPVKRRRPAKGKNTPETVEEVVPAAPSVSEAMLTDTDLTNEDGEAVVVEQVVVPEPEA